MSDVNNPFRINIGFIVAGPIGYSREIQFNIPHFYQKPDFELRDVSGEVVFTRTSEGVLVQGKLVATLPSECVRCLEPFTLRVAPEFNELYVFLTHATRDTELILPPTGIIDLTPLVREYFLLEVPTKPVCHPDCKGLCPICWENLNTFQCNHEDESFDPRLDYFTILLDK